MKLYNSLTRQTEEFRPQKDDQIGVYSCGPTVYEHLHIGNLRAFVVADILNRTLQADHSQAELKHIMNITDVDDKTIARSRKEYTQEDPLVALQKITTKFSQIFLDDMRRVGNRIEALTLTKATSPENISAMQQLIIKLHKAGFAYIADDGIYFSIEAYKKRGKEYGQLTPITSDNTAASRIANDEYDKESPHDFALWKTQKPGEPSWQLEIDNQKLDGRPGWHIECSAMSQRLLGMPFDIHTGGVDLKFPHHENEIAQSTATEKGSVLARFFVHNEHMLVDGQKMSKSLGNVYTLDDVIKRGYDPLALRLLFLQAHYQNQMNFTWEILEAAQNRLKDLRALADLRFQGIKATTTTMSISDPGDMFNAASRIILEAAQNNLDTVKILEELGTFENQINESLVPEAATADFNQFLKTLDGLLGLRLTLGVDIDTAQKEKIAARETARTEQNWKLADELRRQLEHQGIEIRDTPHGPIWSRNYPL